MTDKERAANLPSWI